MDLGEAVAAGLDREIKQRRTDALAVDPRSVYWTDRDAARRMTETGHPLHHPAVIRARQGRRAVTAEEWLMFAFVLSLPPHKLLESDEPLSIGPQQHDNAAVRDWLAGIRPLEGVDPAVFYSTPTAAGPGKHSLFAGELRAKADQFDTATESGERVAILEEVMRAALDEMRGERIRAGWVKRRNREDQAEKGE